MTETAAPKKQRLLVFNERSCDRCSACCVTPSIDEPADQAIGPGVKPAGVACRHLKTHSRFPCAVHADRPKVCSDFICAWAAGSFGPKDRPDKTGLIVTVQRSLTSFQPDGGRDAIVVLEVWAGAARTSGVHLIDAMAKNALVFIIAPDGTKQLQGPYHLVKAAADHIRSLNTPTTAAAADTLDRALEAAQAQPGQVVDVVQTKEPPHGQG